MKKIYYTLLLLAHVMYAQGQACTPDTLYRDSTAGVYPAPLSEMNPNGGIDTFACIDQPFEFVFTVIIPDTFSFNGLTLTLISASIATEGAVSGLPSGIDYECNPPNCIFPADSIGCIVLTGTPDMSNMPGEYEPVITMTINTNIFPITTSFPGSIFPGKYILELRNSQCDLASGETLREPEGWLSFPNPVSDHWNIAFLADDEIRHRLMITDISGRVIHQESWTGTGRQERNIEMGHFSPGIYFYQLNSGDRMATGKISVQE